MNFLIDLVFPPRCAGCGRVDTLWCRDCQRDLDAVPLLVSTHDLTPLAGVIASAPHQGIVQTAVHALKYEGVKSLAGPLARRLAGALSGLQWTFDTLVPVPLHPARQQARGYNQSYELARELSDHLMLPCDPLAVTRWRDTPHQVGLNPAQRLANVQDAFHAEPDSLAGHSLLLIDDVHTTGATLSACATALLQAGATAVYGITVSVAV